MNTTKKYICPICIKGTIQIESERTGPTGFRTTDYTISNTTCNCITYNCEAVAIAIIGSSDEKQIEVDICQECHEEKATLHYPVKAWIGEYKDICPTCFKKEMAFLEATYG